MKRYVRTHWPSAGAVALLLLGATVPAAAQSTGTIQGLVREASTQRALEGAQVFIPGTGLGTITNQQGRFLLQNVPAGQTTVRTQLIGFSQAEQTVQVLAGQSTTLTFELGQSAIQLDEVVVTGQGRARERKELATSVEVLDASELAATPALSVDQLIQGRISGATVSATSAQPGTAGLINFRGVSSVFGSQTPVIYVDGVRVDNSMDTSMDTGGELSSALSDLLASDIDRIEVTKGGAASTLYGSDAATGVIQIFTKKGSVQAPRVTMRIEQGFNQPELKYMLGSGVAFEGQIPEDELPKDFLRDNYFQTGYHQNYYVSVAGGSQDFTYSVSGRTQQSEGVQPENDGQLFSLRGGIQATVSDKVRLDFSGNYTRNSYNRLFNGTSIADPLTSFEVGDALWFTGASNLGDAMEQFLMPDITEEVNRFIFASALRYQPADNIETHVSVGIDNRSNLNRIYEPIGYIVDSASDGQGAVYRFNRDFNSVTLEAAASLSYPQTETLENTFTFGVQGFRDDISTVYGQGLGFALPGAPEIDEAGDITADETNSELFNGGVFFEDQLGLWDQLYLNAGVRLDANTAFGDQVETAVYPKFGVSYLLSETEAFRNLAGGLFSDVKLRAAYGETGKFPPPFLRDRTYSAVSYRGSSAPRFDNPGNEDLGPEVTNTLEFGADMSLFRDRIGFSGTWYRAITQDALFEVPEPPVTGQGSQYRNVGEISNVGWELEATAQLLTRKNLSWDMRTTYNTVKNRVEDMGTAAPFWIGDSYQRVCGPPNNCVAEADGQAQVLEKLPVGTWFLDTPVDTNGDGLLDDTERFYLCADGSLGPGECDDYASPVPKYNGTIGTNVLLFDRLTLTAMADWAAGFYVQDWGSMWATYNGIYRREVVDDDYAYPIQYSMDGEALGEYDIYDAISEFVLDGDFMKLREISARYRVPDGWSSFIGADNAMLYFSVRNVGIWSRNPLIDPELNGVTSGADLQLGGASSITLSPPRMFRFGIELSL